MPKLYGHVAGVMLACLGGTAAAAERPVLRAGTEIPLRSGKRPNSALTQLVLKNLDADDVEMLDECISERELKRGDYGALLRSVRLEGSGHTLWFVRPALEPYCSALYGAHLFRYFIIQERKVAGPPKYQLVFANGGDFINIYAHKSHGLNDIEPSGCIATKCWSARMAYDGLRYRPIRCSVTTWSGEKEVIRPRPCAGMISPFQPSGLDPTP